MCSHARMKNTWAFRGVKIFPHKKLAIPRAQKIGNSKGAKNWQFQGRKKLAIPRAQKIGNSKGAKIYIWKKSGASLPNFPVWPVYTAKLVALNYAIKYTTYNTPIKLCLNTIQISRLSLNTTPRNT